MSKTDNIEALTRLADKAIDTMNEEIAIFEKTLDKTISMSPSSDSEIIREYKALTQKAFNLAKMGKADEAQALIRSFQHGSKNHKSTVQKPVSQ